MRIELSETTVATISTVLAFDTGRYETAILSPLYNNNMIIVVAVYDTETEARQGHKDWHRIMSGNYEDLPDTITPVINTFITAFVHAFSDEPIQYKKAKLTGDET